MPAISSARYSTDVGRAQVIGSGAAVASTADPRGGDGAVIDLRSRYPSRARRSARRWCFAAMIELDMRPCLSLRAACLAGVTSSALFLAPASRARSSSLRLLRRHRRPAQYQPPPQPYQPPPPGYAPPPQGYYGQGYPPPQRPTTTRSSPSASGRAGVRRPSRRRTRRSTRSGPERASATSASASASTTTSKHQPETTGNFLGNGVAPQIDVGARISYRYIPYLFWEHGFMGQGHRFDGSQARSSTDFYGIGFRYAERRRRLGRVPHRFSRLESASSA